MPRLRGLKQVSYKVNTSFALTGLKDDESMCDHQFRLLPTLLKALQSEHPRCHLSVHLPSRVDLVSTLPQLANSSCLHSLTIALHDGQNLACRELFRVLPTCPNLRTLKILSRNFSDSFHKCIYLQYPERGSTAMQLDNLELDGTVFHPEKHLQGGIMPEYGCAAGKETSPFEYFDLLSLKTLSLTNPGHLISLLPSTMNLRSFCFDLAMSHGSEYDNAVKGLLSSVFANQRLAELYLTGCFHLLTIDSMGLLKDSLKRLKIHENEDNSEICKRPVFSEQEIRNLGSIFPNLEYLNLDINYDGEWVWSPSNLFLREHLYLDLKLNHDRMRTASEYLFSNFELFPFLGPPGIKSRNQHFKSYATSPASSNAEQLSWDLELSLERDLRRATPPHPYRTKTSPTHFDRQCRLLSPLSRQIPHQSSGFRRFWGLRRANLSCPPSRKRGQSRPGHRTCHLPTSWKIGTQNRHWDCADAYTIKGAGGGAGESREGSHRRKR